MIQYLWQNRSREPVFGRRWAKAWAKRIYHLPALLGLLRRRSRLIRAGASVGSLTTIDRNARFTGRHKDRLHIGERCAIGKVLIPLHTSVWIGDRVSMNDDVKILPASHDINCPRWTMTYGDIRIDDYAWVATGATLLPGVHIGRGAVVGAGAVVSRDVPEFSIAVGNPAKILSKRRTEAVEYSPVDFISAFEAWLGNPNTRLLKSQSKS
jgi:acetyltransferase-like isoleucine patch superfamily enzyme